MANGARGPGLWRALTLGLAAAVGLGGSAFAAGNEAVAVDRPAGEAADSVKVSPVLPAAEPAGGKDSALEPIHAGAVADEKPLLSLSHAIALAVANSPGLNALDWQAQALCDQAASVAGLDRLSVQLSILGYQTNGPLGVFGSRLSQGRVTPADFDPATLNDPGFLGSIEYGLRLSYPLFNAQRIQLLADALRLGSAATGLDRIRAEHELREDVIRTYFAHDLLEAKLLVLEDAQQVINTLQRDVEALHREGLVIGADIAASQVEAANLADEFSRSAAALDLTENLMSILTGEAPGFESEVPAAAPELPVPEVEACYDDALKYRPDIAAMEQRVEAAALVMEEASRKRRPMLGAFAEGKNASPGWPGDGNQELTVGAQLQLDLDSGGVISSEIAQKLDQYKAACAGLEQLQQRARIEVATAHAGLLSAEGSRHSLAAQSSQAAENLRVQRNRYKEGVASHLEVRMAASALKESRLRELDARYNYILAQMQLLVATGLIGSAVDPFTAEEYIGGEVQDDE